MDYIGTKCPVCNHTFKDGDDVVVCPECGTPHHRECYEALGHCVNEDKHQDNFTFEDTFKSEVTNEDSENDEINEDIICPNCHTRNPASTFYCGHCGAQLGNVKSQNPQQQQQTSQAPFNGFPQNSIAFDPMAGIDPEAEMDDGVTAGELAKFVQKNTQYFLQIFNSIKESCKSRFNFAGFLFSGVYLLYRKMYVAGTIICAIIGLSFVGDFFIQTSPIFDWMTLAQTFTTTPTEFYNFNSTQKLIFMLPAITNAIRFIIMLIIGATVNKSYFKHSIKTVKKIKEKHKDNDKLKNESLQARGGTNFGIAISIAICLMILSNLSYYYLSFFA